MNYSWMVYENGLQLLLQRIPQGRCEYENVLALQTRLQQNITHAKLYGDTEVLYKARKHILSDLNNLTMQVLKGSLIQLCIESCCLFKYLAHVYETARHAHTITIFRDERVLSEQCQWIIDDFRKRPALAEATKGVIESTRVALYHIDTRFIELIRIIEEHVRIHRISSKTVDSKRDEIIRKSSMFIDEMQIIDNKSFKELIEWYQEDILSADASQTYSAHSDEDGPLTKVYVKLERQDQDFVQKPPFYHGEEPSQESTHQREKEASSSKETIDQTALREAIVEGFSMGELRALCADITEALRKGNIHEQVNLDILEGTDLRGKVQSLIEYLNRRGLLSYLVIVVRRTRSHLKF